jgi:hypothetical protein
VNRGLTDWLAKLQPEEAAILSREQNEEFENCKDYQDYQEEANGQADLRQLSKDYQGARESQREDREEDQRTER